MKMLLKKLDVGGMKAYLLPAALIVSALVWLLLSVPQVMRMARLSAEAVSKKQLLAELDRGIQNFSQLEREHESLQSAHVKLQSKLPPQAEFPAILEQISGLARRNNIKIIALEPQRAIPHDSQMFVVIPVFIDAHCGFHDLGRFINDLEFARTFIQVRSFSVNGAEIDEKTHQVVMTVNTFCRSGVN